MWLDGVTSSGDIMFGPDGLLYVSDPEPSGHDRLVALNTCSGDWSPVVEDIGFDIWGLAWLENGLVGLSSNGSVLQINPTSGVASLRSALGSTSWYGAAAVPVAGEAPRCGAWSPLSTGGAPVARRFHTAVWTGSEMIVWGGDAGTAGLRNTGGRFAASSSTWRSMSTVGAPTARYLHTAVWTGSEVIVWGGVEVYYGVSGVRTGARYSADADTWVATTTTGAPSASYRHSAVWTGSEMITWGGYGSASTGGRYDPIADSWSPTPTAGAPGRRFGHVAVWTGSEMVVWGGCNWDVLGNCLGLVSGGLFNPVTSSWRSMSMEGTPTGGDYTALGLYSAVWNGAEMIVWAGGGSLDGGRYDPATNVWRPLATLNSPESYGGSSTVWTGSELVAWGGESLATGWGGYRTPFATGGRYSPTAAEWISLATWAAPGARYNHSAVWTGSEMLVFGGQTDRYILSSGRRFIP